MFMDKKYWKTLFVDYDTFFKVNDFKKKYYEDCKWLYQRRFEPLLYGVIGLIAALAAIFFMVIAITGF